MSSLVFTPVKYPVFPPVKHPASTPVKYPDLISAFMSDSLPSSIRHHNRPRWCRRSLSSLPSSRILSRRLLPSIATQHLLPLESHTVASMSPAASQLSAASHLPDASLHPVENMASILGPPPCHLTLSAKSCLRRRRRCRKKGTPLSYVGAQQPFEHGSRRLRCRSSSTPVTPSSSSYSTTPSSSSHSPMARQHHADFVTIGDIPVALSPLPTQSSLRPLPYRHLVDVKPIETPLLHSSIPSRTPNVTPSSLRISIDVHDVGGFNGGVTPPQQQLHCLRVPGLWIRASSSVPLDVGLHP